MCSSRHHMHYWADCIVPATYILLYVVNVKHNGGQSFESMSPLCYLVHNHVPPAAFLNVAQWLQFTSPIAQSRMRSTLRNHASCVVTSQPRSQRHAYLCAIILVVLSNHFPHRMLYSNRLYKNMKVIVEFKLNYRHFNICFLSFL